MKLLKIIIVAPFMLIGLALVLFCDLCCWVGEAVHRWINPGVTWWFPSVNNDESENKVKEL